MGRHKEFKIEEHAKKDAEQWPEDVKCSICGYETKAHDIKVYGSQSGRRLLKLKCGHSVFK